MLGWVLFRADSLKTGIDMVRSMVTVYNSWILFDDSLLQLGLNWKEWQVLIYFILVMVFVDY